jgi:GrpB-like predicted nucleotidyltransferase (UPF0157 family)
MRGDREGSEAWHGRLAGLLGPVARRVEHVGSTSVPGLAAKPVVDIQANLRAHGGQDPRRSCWTGR